MVLKNTASVPRCCHTALQLDPHMAGHAGSRCSHQHKSMGSTYHRAPASSPSSGWRPSSCPDAVCLSAEHQRALAACKKHMPHALLLLWVISSTAACMTFPQVVPSCCLHSAMPQSVLHCACMTEAADLLLSRLGLLRLRRRRSSCLCCFCGAAGCTACTSGPSSVMSAVPSSMPQKASQDCQGPLRIIQMAM